MINRIFILLASVIITGASTYIYKSWQAKAELKHLKQIIKNKGDTLKFQKDTITIQQLNIRHLAQKDSLNQLLAKGKERTLLEQRNLLRRSETERKEAIINLKSCEKWKADAQDDGIITPDTIRVKKRFLRKGYKIVKPNAIHLTKTTKSPILM